MACSPVWLSSCWAGLWLLWHRHTLLDRQLMQEWTSASPTPWMRLSLSLALLGRLMLGRGGSAHISLWKTTDVDRAELAAVVATGPAVEADHIDLVRDSLDLLLGFYCMDNTDLGSISWPLLLKFAKSFWEIP